MFSFGDVLLRGLIHQECTTMQILHVHRVTTVGSLGDQLLYSAAINRSNQNHLPYEHGSDESNTSVATSSISYSLRFFRVPQQTLNDTEDETFNIFVAIFSGKLELGTRKMLPSGRQSLARIQGRMKSNCTIVFPPASPPAMPNQPGKASPSRLAPGA